MPFETDKNRVRLWLIGLALVISIGAVLCLIAVPLILMAVQNARETARREQCVNNLKQISLALAEYRRQHPDSAPDATKPAFDEDAGKQKQEPVPAKSLTHASRQLLIDGWTPERVQERYGRPKETKRSQFTPPKYGVPKTLPEMDEQWYFPLEMGHRLVCFKQGKVVLAIEEWSDF
jgi:hypothetical protein